MARKGRYSKKKNTDSLKKKAKEALRNMWEEGRGRSRDADKKTGIDHQFIYSKNTYETYVKQVMYFVSWVEENHPECKRLKDMKPFVNEWLQLNIDENKSAYTITTRKSAIAKLLKTPYNEFIKTPERRRADIKRSRFPAERDKHISQAKEQYWANINSALGMRSFEFKRARGTDLREHVDANGNKQYTVLIKGKGGKLRTSMIIGRTPEETEQIAQMFRDAGKEKVFHGIPKAFDFHRYRAEYAKRAYELMARPLKDIPPEARYIMRAERAGETFDKKAMAFASRMLGHNRIDVIAQSYLYTSLPEMLY